MTYLLTILVVVLSACGSTHDADNHRVDAATTTRVDTSSRQPDLLNTPPLDTFEDTASGEDVDDADSSPPREDMNVVADVDVPDSVEMPVDTSPRPMVKDVALVNGELFVHGEPFFIQGVAWSPVAAGNTLDQLDFAGYVEQDSALMAAAGINVVRTYVAITDRAVLDTLYRRGIYVLNAVYVWGGEPVENVRAKINAVADHPAVIMWLIGNEWNYNGLYAGFSPEESIQRLNAVAALIREVDPMTPIGAVYGETPPVATVNAMPLVDIWGINAYRGISFYALFNDWQRRSNKPMFLAEFGADAWNANIGAEDQASQTEATLALIAEISANRHRRGGPCVGGVIFEWADEWWKDETGSPDTHDTGGIAPGGGPHPDATFNEEWWGLVDINRVPRQVYHQLPAMW